MVKKIFVASFFLCGIIFYLSLPKIFLSAEIEGKEKILRVIDAREGAPIEIKFIHSVQKTPVFEELEFYSGEFVLRRTKYQSQGVGLPFSECDGNFHREGNFFVMDNMNRHFKEINLRSGVGSKLCVNFGGEEFRLYELFPLGTKFNIRQGNNFR